MISEMRQLVRLWTHAPLEENRDAVIRANPLGKATRSRVIDVLNRIFIPRFVQGSIPVAWTFLRALEEENASPAILRPVYYWVTARAEPLLSDFVTESLFRQRGTGQRSVSISDFNGWLATKNMGWSDNVAVKSGRAILAALRDFGVLEGKAKKFLVRPPLPLGAFAFIAFCLTQLGIPGRDMLEHPDWTLFMRRGTLRAFILIGGYTTIRTGDSIPRVPKRPDVLRALATVPGVTGPASSGWAFRSLELVAC